MTDTIFPGSGKSDPQQALFCLMLNKHHDYLSRRTATDTTFRIFMFLLLILPDFLSSALGNSFKHLRSQDYGILFASMLIWLLWHLARLSLDAHTQRIEIELFRLAEEKGGRLTDGFIRSNSMFYRSFLLRRISINEPSVWVSAIGVSCFIRYIRSI
jgi:hypothetical protein